MTFAHPVFPFAIATQRLELRSPSLGDEAAIHHGIKESFAELTRWLTWAKMMPSLQEVDTMNRESMARFIQGTGFNFRIFLRQTGEFAGCIGASPGDPDVPSFEIGYWLRTPLQGKGYMVEAVGAVREFARQHLRARRLQIRTDERNVASWKVAERAGFQWEGSMPSFGRDNGGVLFTMRVYGKTF